MQEFTLTVNVKVNMGGTVSAADVYSEIQALLDTWQAGNATVNECEEKE